jgi:hypothetical protein
MDMRVILKLLLKYYLELSTGRIYRGFLLFMGIVYRVMELQIA